MNEEPRPDHALSEATHTEIKPNPDHLNKLKIYFLYVFIGGISVAAIISVIALLIGSFNETLARALGTTFLFVIHSAVILLLILADTRNHLGKSVILNTVLVSLVASLAISTLGIWEIIPEDVVGRLFGVLTLLTGAAFIVSGLLQLRLKHRATNILVYLSIGLAVLLVGLVAPWILFTDSNVVTLSAYYYRIIGAAAILLVTSAIVLAIVHRVALHQHQDIRIAKPTPYPAGLLAAIITIGSLVALVWFGGVFVLIADADSQSNQERYPSSRSNDYRDDYDPYDRGGYYRD